MDHAPDQSTRNPEPLRRRMRRQLLRDLYHGVPLAAESLDGINEYYGYHLKPGVYNILMIRFQLRPDATRPLADILRWADEDMMMFFRSSLIEEAETLLTDNAIYCMFNFTTLPHSPETLRIRQIIASIFDFLDRSHRYHQCFFALSEGYPAHTVQDLNSSFLSAQDAVAEYGQTLHYNSRNDSVIQMYATTQIMMVLDPVRRAAFGHYLETAQQAQLLQWVDEVFRDCTPFLEEFPTIALLLPHKILDLCLEAVSKKLSTDPNLQRILIECRKAVYAEQDYQQLCRITKDGLLQFCSQYAASLSREQNQAVIAAKSYMWLNYTRRLTLEEIAAHVHLNSQYFSVLFKRETGQSVVDHLTRLRIDRAKELLKGTIQPIGEIARAVSYDDPDYFSRVFRKQCGLSPRQYRNATSGS